MSVNRPILIHPDPRLRQVSRPVEAFESIRDLEKELKVAMQSGPGGVGIAAPQIGELQRVILVDCRHSRKPCRNHGFLLLCNPLIVDHSGKTLGREGCLSVPDWVGIVPRAKTIRLRYQDAEGNEQMMETSGFEARVIQHELDHLDGILFIDRVVSSHDLVRRISVSS